MSPRSVQTAADVLTRAPEEVINAVKKGEMSLAAAEKSLPAKPTKPPKAAKAQDDKYSAAIERIGKVCGAKVRKAIEDGILTNVTAKDAIFWASLNDAEMADIERLVVGQRWKPETAWKQVKRIVSATTRVAELLNLTIAAGGSWEATVNGFTINVKAPKRR